jgi:anaphase-promoting complex subunit 4
MRFLCHQLLIYANAEHRQFATFSRWLKHEIDVQATDPNSASAEETAERDLGIDYGLLLGYVQGALEQSKIDAFVVVGKGMGALGTGNEVYGDVKKALDAFRKGEDCDTGILALQSHFDQWTRCSRVLVDQITSHQRSSSFMNCGIVLDKGELVAKDMRMVFESLNRATNEEGVEGIEDKDLTTYCAIVKQNDQNEGKFANSIIMHNQLIFMYSLHISNYPLRYVRRIQSHAWDTGHNSTI